MEIRNMSKKVIIELSLIKEGNNKIKNQIIEDIVFSFSKKDIIIPWCKQLEKIKILTKTNSKIS